MLRNIAIIWATWFTPGWKTQGVAGSDFPVAQLVVSVRLLILRSAVRARPGKFLCPRAAHQQKNRKNTNKKIAKNNNPKTRSTL